MTREKYSLGIALSGGGARGFAHIGVLKALLEHDLEPEIVSGTSAGAVVGTLYAAGLSIEEMTQFVKSANYLRALLPSWPNKGLISLSYLRKHLQKHLPKDQFEELHKELYIVISNLNSGQAEVRNSGSLLKVVTASSAIPLIFQPVSIDDNTYVDGGLFMNLPAEPIRDKCRYLIGVNLTPPVELPPKKIRSVRSVLERSFDLVVLSNTRPQMQFCDVLIQPKPLVNYHIFQFSKGDELIKLGYEATLVQIDNIKKDLEQLDEI